jgi:YbgC/YbaW family acyl-CoA thioester hydrolase
MSLNHSEFQSCVQVRPDDIDLFGHVHSAKYLDYFLAARFEQMQKNYNCGMDEFLSKGLGWFLQDFDISYKRPLKLGDTAMVYTNIMELQNNGSIVAFRILNQQSNKLVATGKGKFALVDIQSARSVAIPDWVIERYSINIENP